MFIGHFAVGFAAKRFAPRAPLGWLIGAALFLDLVWPVLVLAGIEVVRPQSRGALKTLSRVALCHV